MPIVSSKAELKPILVSILADYTSEAPDIFVGALHDNILKKKVRYPILEYAAQELYKHIPERDHIIVTDKIIALKENGSEVIAGKMLQLRLPAHFDKSIDKAVEYIIAGDHWLPCDTVGERVLGHALLTLPEKTLPILQQLSLHHDKWVVRSVGVATHYAVKKGLRKTYVEEMFRLLLSQANTTEFHTKKGIGWAAKTIAKFHPDIISQYEEQVNNDPAIKQWFRSKIRIGLSRTYKYAHRYTS